MIQILRVSILLLTISCNIIFKDHDKELKIAVEKAAAFCFCHGGVKTMKQRKYTSIDDEFDVMCKDGKTNFAVNEYVIFNQVCDE